MGYGHMKNKQLEISILGVAILVATTACLIFKKALGSTNSNNIAKLPTLHQRLGKPLPGHWLNTVKESGQTFAQYVKSKPNGITEKRNKVYIRPIGNLSETEKKVLELTAKYLEKFYVVPVVLLDSISIKTIPATSFRIHQGSRQASATYILNTVLEPTIPDDAAGYIAFTKIDLYTHTNNNFVFGLGNTVNRTGVYSMARFGDPDKGESDYKTFVARTLKVASHELGHIFGIRHCIAYECLMNGSNSLTESDFKPVYLCPIDLKKVCWRMETDEVRRFIALKSFWAQNDFETHSKFYDRSLALFDATVSE